MADTCFHVSQKSPNDFELAKSKFKEFFQSQLWQDLMAYGPDGRSVGYDLICKMVKSDRVVFFDDDQKPTHDSLGMASKLCCQVKQRMMELEKEKPKEPEDLNGYILMYTGSVAVMPPIDLTSQLDDFRNFVKLLLEIVSLFVRKSLSDGLDLTTEQTEQVIKFMAVAVLYEIILKYPPATDKRLSYQADEGLSESIAEEIDIKLSDFDDKLNRAIDIVLLNVLMRIVIGVADGDYSSEQVKEDLEYITENFSAPFRELSNNIEVFLNNPMSTQMLSQYLDEAAVDHRFETNPRFLLALQNAYNEISSSNIPSGMLINLGLILRALLGIIFMGIQSIIGDIEGRTDSSGMMTIQPVPDPYSNSEYQKKIQQE